MIMFSFIHSFALVFLFVGKNKKQNKNDFCFDKMDNNNNNIISL